MYRSVGSRTSTAVIWFIVSVPVLSELIADVEPSVSTEARSVNTAPCRARSAAPTDMTTWSTVGIASGIAAIASATALVNTTVEDRPRCAPSTNMITIVTPAAAAIHSVNVLSCLVSGVSSRVVVASIPAIFPTCVSAPVAVTIITPLPCVIGVCMNAMSVCSPGARSWPSGTSTPLEAGTLSPVKAASSICKALAEMIRPSAGTSSPAASRTMSPTTTSSAGMSASDPSRRTRAVALTIAWSAFIALCAFPSWRRPTTALSTVIRISRTPVLHSLIASDTIAAATRMICM